MFSVIGVHSSCIARSSPTAGAPSFWAGHAWLTMHYTNGRMGSIGLWAEGSFLSMRHLVKDRIGISSDTAENFEIRFDEELKNHYRAESSRYYGLYQGQQNKAIRALGRYAGWRASHTCATWVTEKVEEIFGVSLASREFLGITNTPRELGVCLWRLESKNPTSVSRPLYVP